MSEERTAAIPVDIIVVGGGIAGASAAIALGRQGHAVAVVDTHAVSPPEFRAEKLGEEHIRLLQKLDLFDIVRPVCTPVDVTDVFRYRRHYARERRREYGFAYADVVNALRRAFPPGVALVVGRVAEVAAGPDVQRVTLADGRTYEGRLLVVATGLGDTIRRHLGIARRPERQSLSLSFGFDLAHPARDYPFETVTAYGSLRSDRIAYFTAFPLGDVMRGNLFVYRDTADDWSKRFRREPEPLLRQTMPELADICRGFAIAGRIEPRPMELVTVENAKRDGFVLIGDAFQTTCPVPGLGVAKVLTDVDRLVTHAPGWLVTPGMSVAKIAAYYDDPIKVAFDAAATTASLYARSMVLDDGPVWALRRLRNAIVRQGWLAARALVGAAPSLDAPATPSARQPGPVLGLAASD